MRNDVWIVAAVLSALHVVAEPVEEVYRSRAPGTVTALAFHPEGKSIAVGGSSGRLLLLSPDNGSEVRYWSIPRSGLGAIAFSPDGTQLAGGVYNAMVVWQADSKTILHRLKTKSGRVLSMAYSPDGKRLAVSGSDRKIRLYGVDSDYAETDMIAARAGVSSLSFSPASGDLLGVQADRATLWNLKQKSSPFEFKGHRGPVSGAAFLDGGNMVISAAIEGSVMLWESQGGREKHNDSGVRVSTVAGHPSSRIAVTGSGSKEIAIRRADNGEVLHRIMDLKRDVASLAISPDGTRLVAGMRAPGDTLIIWSLDVEALYGGEGNPGGSDAPEKVEYLSALESAVIREHNIARTDPSAYVKILKAYKATYMGDNVFNVGGRRLMTNEGLKAVDEAIAALEKQKPVPPLKPSEGLSKASSVHTADLGPKGLVGHTGSDGSQPVERISRFGKWEKTNGENIAFGPSEAQRIVMNLIVDDGVPSRGHRLNIYNRDYRVLGVGIGPHQTYGHMCTLNYAGGFKDNK